MKFGTAICLLLALAFAERCGRQESTGDIVTGEVSWEEEITMSYESAAKPTSYEIEVSREWAIAHFGSETSVPPVSFMYGGIPSADLL